MRKTSTRVASYRKSRTGFFSGFPSESSSPLGSPTGVESKVEMLWVGSGESPGGGLRSGTIRSADLGTSTGVTVTSLVGRHEPVSGGGGPLFYVYLVYREDVGRPVINDPSSDL